MDTYDSTDGKVMILLFISISKVNKPFLLFLGISDPLQSYISNISKCTFLSPKSQIIIK